MFSVVFPGQGSQKIGMAKEFFDKFEIVKKIFKDADDLLELPISKIIFERFKHQSYYLNHQG